MTLTSSQNTENNFQNIFLLRLFALQRAMVITFTKHDLLHMFFFSIKQEDRFQSSFLNELLELTDNLHTTLSQNTQRLHKGFIFFCQPTLKPFLFL